MLGMFQACCEYVVSMAGAFSEAHLHSTLEKGQARIAMWATTGDDDDGQRRTTTNDDGRRRTTANDERRRATTDDDDRAMRWKCCVDVVMVKAD